MSSKDSSAYVLDSQTEFDRLERQSTFAKYDYKRELALSKKNFTQFKSILDAGCGSGVVARYLANANPQAKVTGCDYSKDRLILAEQKARSNKNLSFVSADVTELPFKDEEFDLIVSRYVLQHVEAPKRNRAIQEFFRCLQPGKSIVLIDFDGAFYNVFPRSGLVDEVLTKLENHGPVDLRIGRKLAWMLSQAGFENVEWHIETIECKDQALVDEVEMVTEKLESAEKFLAGFLGDSEKAHQFRSDYLKAMTEKGSVLFYNKFIVTATKPQQRQKVLKLVGSS